MSLLHTARLNGLQPYAYLKAVWGTTADSASFSDDRPIALPLGAHGIKAGALGVTMIWPDAYSYALLWTARM